MNWKTKIKSFLGQCKITLRLLKYPTKNELETILEITSIGTLIIGAIGFAIRAAFWYLFHI